MPQGLQTFDQFGNLKLDLSDRIGRFLGIVFATAGVAGSIVNDGFLTGQPFCFASMASSGGASWPGDNLYPPTISFSGSTMFWTAPVANTRLHMWVF